MADSLWAGEPHADSTSTKLNSTTKALYFVNSNIQISPQENFRVPNNLPSWNVETLAGTPKVGNSFQIGKLAVGEFLETDANSRARVQVANIGNVEIAPNSRGPEIHDQNTSPRRAEYPSES